MGLASVLAEVSWNRSLTLNALRPSFYRHYFMSEIPNPAGVPPKPAEAPKVQPKKETVRIPLPSPPKQAASTIKLPAMPSGGPPPPSAPAPMAPPPPAAAAAAPAPVAPKPAAPAPPAPPPAGAPSSSLAKPVHAGAVPAAASAAAGKPGSQPARPAAAYGKGVSTIDIALAAVAMVAAIAAVVSVVLLNGVSQG